VYSSPAMVMCKRVDIQLHLVREGSIVWYLKQLVTARAVRYTFGTEIGEVYNSKNALHLSRENLKYVNARYEI
jgi:hypothetical protein